MPRAKLRLTELLERHASTMPPLRHSRTGCDFDIMSSEVAVWLCSIPEVRQQVFDAANASGAIVYDQGTGRWRGVDHEG